MVGVCCEYQQSFLTGPDVFSEKQMQICLQVRTTVFGLGGADRLMQRNRKNGQNLVVFHSEPGSQLSHLQGAAVALLSMLQEAVAAHRWSLQAQVGGFVHQAARLPRGQVLLIANAAAAAEGARDVPAGETDTQTGPGPADCSNCSTCPS